MGLISKREFAAFLSVICLILFFGCTGKEGGGEREDILPRFSFKDMLGRNLRLETVKDRYICIQFLKSLPREKEESIHRMVREFEASDKFILVFVTGENRIPTFYSIENKNIFFVLDRNNSIKNRFHSPLCCNSFCIYNQQHELMYSGMLNDSVHKEVRSLLLEILGRNSIQHFDARYRLGKIEECGLPAAIASELGLFNQKPRYHLVGLLNKVCSECSSGAIISHLNRLYNASSDSISLVILVSEEFSDMDLVNLIKSLRINIPVKRAPVEIIDVWNQLKGNLPGFFDNVFLILDSQGSIRGFLDERNPEIFYTKLKNILENE